MKDTVSFIYCVPTQEKMLGRTDLSTQKKQLKVLVLLLDYEKFENHEKPRTATKFLGTNWMFFMQQRQATKVQHININI